MACSHTEQEAIIAALCAPAASISAKYFYDVRGSALFERITHLPEYYPTRTEAAILRDHGPGIAGRIRRDGTIVELGAGNCRKARLLCELVGPRHFVAVDICADFVRRCASQLQSVLPSVHVHSVAADLTTDFVLPADVPPGARTVFYPGSSIGNFTPPQALALLQRMHRLCAPGGDVLIGVDLLKDVAVLDAAYNDAEGLTAAFNLNVLEHVNRLTGADFDPAQWQHCAFFNAAASRIEMHLQARTALTVRWPGRQRRFARGERIHTENSYKYAPAAFTTLLTHAGFRDIQLWTDPFRWFALFHARRF